MPLALITLVVSVVLLVGLVLCLALIAWGVSKPPTLAACGTCGGAVHRIAGDALPHHLSAQERFELQLGSSQFHGWLCEAGHPTIVRRARKLSGYSTCAKCGVRAVATTPVMTLGVLGDGIPDMTMWEGQCKHCDASSSELHVLSG